MVIIFLARDVSGHAPVVPKPTGILLLAFLFLGLASAFAALSLQHAIFEWSSLLLLLVLIFIIAEELAQDAGRLTTLLPWVGIACALYSLRVVVMYAAALASGFQDDLHELAVGFSNARFLNHSQTPLLPLIVLLCLQAPTAGRWRKAWFVLAAFWWALLFATEARASILALGVGCAASCMLRRGHARQYMATMAWTAAAGAVLYALLFILLPVTVGLDPLGGPSKVLERTAADPGSGRFTFWKLAMDLIAEHPWLGIGPQHFAHEGSNWTTGAHPHDWLLQIGAEWGIPALLCLLGVVFLGARALARSGARLATDDVANQQMLVTLQVACAAVFVDGLFSGVIVMPQSQLAIALVLGIACAWVRLNVGVTQPSSTFSSAASRALLTVVVTAGLGGLIWSVAPDIVRHARGDALTPAEQAANPGPHWSRMWEAGHF